MKCLKKLVLLAAATSLIVLVAASSASATALYNGTTSLGVGAELDFSLKFGTSALLVSTEGGELDKCSGSTVRGSITNAGGASATVSGNISELTWTGCTFPTTTTIKGGLEVHQIGSSTEGTVTSNAEIGVTINTIFFGSCVYGVKSATDLGKITSFSSGTAEFHANAVAVKLSGSNFACPETSKWTGTYVSTTPDNLRVEASGSGGGGEEEGIPLRSTPGAFNFFVGVEQTKSIVLEGTKAQVATVTSGALEASGGGSPPASLDLQNVNCFLDVTYSLGGSTCTVSIKNTASTPSGTYFLHMKVDVGGSTSAKDKYISINVS
jgi:hypothetical protein